MLSQVRDRLSQHKEKKYESEQIDFVPDGELVSLFWVLGFRMLDQ